MMNDVVKLEALADELAAGPDGSETLSVADHPEIKTLELLRASTMDRLHAIEALTLERDNYKRGLEVSEAQRATDGEVYEAKIADQARRIAKLSSDLTYFQNVCDRQRETLEAAERLITRGRMNAQHDYANRPQPDDVPAEMPDDSDPLPKTGAPWRNVRPLPQAQDITQFVPRGMRR